MKSWQFHASCEADTERLGAALAGVLQPGSVIGLLGDLGAGKTRFVQATAEALGADRRAVTSPTFVLLQEYEGRLPIYHFDAYRLGGPQEFLDLGADELLASTGVCFIEWADRVADALPADRLIVEIEMTGQQSRLFRSTATGTTSSTLLAKLFDHIGK